MASKLVTLGQKNRPGPRQDLAGSEGERLFGSDSSGPVQKLPGLLLGLLYMK